VYEYNLGLRFQNIAKQYPDKAAIWFDGDNFITYAGLNKAANRMARRLMGLGIEYGDVVCIASTKSLYTFASIVACLKIGAIYSIFDPDSPITRLHKIFLTCNPKVQLSLWPNREEPAFPDYDDSDLPCDFPGSTPAYIMYTSGSTGIPKGAVITHDNVLNLIEWSKETYSITPNDILTNVNPLYFDNSVFDFYSALFNGACLVPFTKEEVRNPKTLVEKVDRAGCTLWFSVPSLLMFLQTMRAADGKYLRSIKRFVFGGEGYPKAKLKKLYDVYDAEFHNVYGPTECTCICSSYKIADEDFEDPRGIFPLGQIAKNFGYLILSGGLESAEGELCLFGPNVGKGYYNDNDRTKENFIQNPLAKYPEIMYTTGDMVRFTDKLYFLGRKDNQIKHMGYRIELEEIEAALYCLDYVSEAAVVYSDRIIAIVVTDKSDDEIRKGLKQIIPDYMIPSVFHYEDVLPKNANGKVDRKVLKEKYG